MQGYSSSIAGNTPGKVYNRLGCIIRMRSDVADDDVNESGPASMVGSATALGALWWWIGGRDGALSVGWDIVRIDGVASDMKQ